MKRDTLLTMGPSLASFSLALMRLASTQTLLRENPENDRSLKENTAAIQKMSGTFKAFQEPLSIDTAGVTNAMLPYSALTIAAGTDLTGGGAVTLGGHVDIEPGGQQGATTARGQCVHCNQTVNGNLSATEVATGSSFEIGSNLFAFGSFVNVNAFLGFASDTSAMGIANKASDEGALASLTTGTFNTASGRGAAHMNRHDGPA